MVCSLHELLQGGYFQGVISRNIVYSFIDVSQKRLLISFSRLVHLGHTWMYTGVYFASRWLSRRCTSSHDTLLFFTRALVRNSDHTYSLSLSLSLSLSSLSLSLAKPFLSLVPRQFT
jgi:hypothetical protein